MTSTTGYIGIALISLAISAFAIYMKRDAHKVSTYIVFYLFTASITWVGEFIVLGLFDSYAYKTGLFEDVWAQNLLGHLFLNASMFPAAAIVMVSFSLRYGYFAPAATIFVLIEYIFGKLGFYEQHWWRYYMSVINLTIFLLISQKWFAKMNHERCGLTRATVFYFFSFLLKHLPAPILLLLDKQHYQFDPIDNLVNNYYRSSIMVSFIYHLLFSVISTFFVCVLRKWYWTIMPFVLSAVIAIIFVRINILIIHDGWNLLFYILIQQMMLFVFVLFERHTLKPNKECPE